MRKFLLMFALSLAAGTLSVSAGAHGCIKGAVVGGVAGHLAGHHALAGAAVGCAVGHHRAKVKEKEDARAGRPTPPGGSPGAAAREIATGR